MRPKRLRRSDGDAARTGSAQARIYPIGIIAEEASSSFSFAAQGPLPMSPGASAFPWSEGGLRRPRPLLARTASAAGLQREREGQLSDCESPPVEFGFETVFQGSDAASDSQHAADEEQEAAAQGCVTSPTVLAVSRLRVATPKHFGPPQAASATEATLPCNDQENEDAACASPRLCVAQTPPRTSTSSVGGNGCDASPGELGGLLYIQSPPQNTRTTRAPPLFSVFLPRGTKVLHLVRHGESTYNAACGAPGSSWEEPDIYDARLTDRGRTQANAVGPRLAGIPVDALWVTSPLTRAIETCLLARTSAHGAPIEGNSWVAVRPELAEHLVTSGDIGRPRAALQKDFPSIQDAMEELDDVWWYQRDAKPNCALRKLLQSQEPKSAFRARVGLFRRWVLSRPEEEMVIFGHSTFFKELMGGDRRLANCEVHTMRF